VGLAQGQTAVVSGLFPRGYSSFAAVNEKTPSELSPGALIVRANQFAATT
jgi:hypothetical protein